jgi:hypothetical protein
VCMTERLGDFGRRLAAWAVLVLVAILALKLFAGVVIGFFQLVMTIVIVIALGAAVIWALRRL